MVDPGPTMELSQCPSYAAALGYMGVAAAVCLSNWGSAVRNVVVVAKYGVTNQKIQQGSILTFSHNFAFKDRNI